MNVADFIRLSDDDRLADIMVMIAVTVIKECVDSEIKQDGINEAKKICLKLLRKELGK